MLKFAALAVAASITGPGYSGTVDDAQLAGASLGTLIERHWIEGEAKERGIVVESTSPTRTERLAQAIRDQVSEAAARSVTPADVQAYVAANPVMQPAERTVRVVQARSTREARRVLRRIERGTSWAAVGGERITVARADHPAGKAIFAAKLNRLKRHGRWVLRVSRHTPARPLNRALQETMAWERLTSQAQERALQTFLVQFTAKWRALTTCAPQYAADPHCAAPSSGQETP